MVIGVAVSERFRLTMGQTGDHEELIAQRHQWTEDG